MKKDLQHNTAVYYIIIFYTLFLYKLYNGLLLCQMQPFFLYNRDDIFTWLFMQTNLPQWLLLHPQYFVLFDTAFYGIPLFFLYTIIKKQRIAPIAAFIMLLVNWIYIQCYTLYPTNSITLYIAWLIFPVVFLVKNENLFFLLLQGLRYFFLYFFFSAGLWKIVNGGVFNPLQMSAILLNQHKETLAGTSSWWMKWLTAWLVLHTAFSYTLYLLATSMELSFGIGFFTRKYDTVLIVIYILFLLANHVVMRIPYYETLPFLLIFYLKKANISAGEA